MPYDDVFFTGQVEAWLMSLGDDDYDSIQAIVLVGGDKRDDWTGWYERNIPLADDLLDTHLDSLREDAT